MKRNKHWHHKRSSWDADWAILQSNLDTQTKVKSHAEAFQQTVVENEVALGKIMKLFKGATECVSSRGTTRAILLFIQVRTLVTNGV